jgi:CDGSH-type Zn-finger protein
MAEFEIVAETEIVPCPDGPILVRGSFTIVGATGPSVDRGRRTVALCRCGLSQRKLFCDGTHRMTGFRTDEPAPAQPEPLQPEPTQPEEGLPPQDA